ncbi:hatching enzyme 1.2-like [Engraulis encrasicolus]|uniref:hatching enzyme 1.2-like n=1 Tax=Engraulis encrasicolus TaxID=184585 RepID=UPI002FD0BB1F
MGRKLAAILALLLAVSQALAQAEESQEDQYDLEDEEEEMEVSDEFLDEKQVRFLDEAEKEGSMTGDILEANKWLFSYLSEGDVAVPTGRNAMKCTNCYWEKAASGFVEVPYRLSDNYSYPQKKLIKRAMGVFHKNTCIRFVPHTSQRDYIDIMSKPGCWSYIGRIGGRQTVSLNMRGCMSMSVTQHELNHALGFFHEHTRSDRDKYIKINWQYVVKSAVSQFGKRDTNNLDTTYDYNSIMHYDRFAFTNTPGRETLTPIPKRVSVGPRAKLSKTDIERINKLYCGATGPTTTTTTIPPPTTTKTTTTTAPTTTTTEAPVTKTPCPYDDGE